MNFILSKHNQGLMPPVPPSFSARSPFQPRQPVVASPEAAGTARPKFMPRPARPAQRNSDTPPRETPHIPEQQQAEHAPILWYEDFRFGVFLLAVLLVLNLLLVVATPWLTPSSYQEIATTTPAYLQPGTSGHRTITLYSGGATPEIAQPPSATQAPEPQPMRDHTAIAPPEAMPLDHGKSMEENIRSGSEQ